MRTSTRAAGAVALLLLAAGLGPAGCDRGPAALELRHPPLRVEPSELRLPRIPFGKGASGEIRLTNEGDEEVVITGIGPTGCDCTMADLVLPDRPEGGRRVRVQDSGMRVALRPGETAVLEVTLSTLRSRQPTRFKASAIPIHFEGWDYLAVEYSADIWVPFWTEPWAVQLGTVGARERRPALVTVRGLEEEEFEILAPEQVDGWELRVTRVADAPAAYNVEAVPPPELPRGPFQQDFELNTSFPEMKVRFTVIGLAVADVTHSPQRVLLRPDEGVREGRVAVRMLPADRGLAILEAVAETESGAPLEVDVTPTEPGRGYAVTVRLPAESDGAPAERATLRVRTDDEETPLIEVPIQILRTAR